MPVAVLEMTPNLYADPEGVLQVEKRRYARRQADRHIRRYFWLLGTVILVLITIVIAQRWAYVQRVEAISAKVEHRVDLSQRDEEIASTYDPENGWLCRHRPVTRM